MGQIHVVLLVSLAVFLAGVGYIWEFSSLIGNDYYISPVQNVDDILFGPEKFNSHVSCAGSLLCTEPFVCCYYTASSQKLSFLRESRLECLIPEDCRSMGTIVG